MLATINTTIDNQRSAFVPIYKTGYQIEGANSYADVKLIKNYFINVKPAKIVFEKMEKYSVK